MYEIVVKEAVSVLVSRLVILLQNFQNSRTFIRLTEEVNTNRQAIEKALCEHLVEVNNWAQSIRVSGTSVSKPIKIYVNLRYTNEPRMLRSRQKYSAENIKLSDILAKNKNLLIVGGVGIGKTTTVQKLANHLLRRVDNNRKIPIVVRLRNIVEDGLIAYILKNVLPLDFVLSNKVRVVLDREKEGEYLHKIILHEILDSIDAFILLDGFDELDYQRKRLVLDDVIYLSAHMQKSRIIMTTRPNDIATQLVGFGVCEIEELNSAQIKEFVDNWFSDHTDGDKLVNGFYQSIASVPYDDLFRRPLFLATLCKIFEFEQEFPEQAYEIYEHMLELVIKDVDRSKGISRKSRIERFGYTKKKRMISSLSFQLNILSGRSVIVFTREDLYAAFTEIHQVFKLSLDDFDDIVDEIEEYTSIIVREACNRYAFFHKSMQEYLFAYYLYTTNDISNPLPYLSKYPNEFAIYIAMNQDPNLAMHYICKNIESSRVDYYEDNINQFVERLSIESVSFRPTIQNGYDMLVLSEVMATKYFSSIRYEQEMADIFNKVIKISGVYNSVLKYIDQCRQYSTSIFPRAVELVFENTEIVEKLRLKHILVPKEFLEQLNTDPLDGFPKNSVYFPN